MLRVALVGCGAHSEAAHARSLAHFAATNPGTIQLAAACDLDLRRAERFCGEYGFAAPYDRVEEMLDAAIPDAVVAVLPVEAILAVSGELLRRGIPSVVEKPPGRSIAEARALAQIARETGTPHMVSMNRRFTPVLNRAISWARQIGPLRYVRATMLRHARTEADFLWGTGIHVVDAVRYIGGEVADSDVRRLDTSAVVPPWYAISLRFVSGCAGQIEILPTTGAVDETFELFGDGFHCAVRTMGAEGAAVRCCRNGTLEVEAVLPSTDPTFLRDGSFEETMAFLEAVRSGSPLRPTLDDVLPSLEMCLSDSG